MSIYAEMASLAEETLQETETVAFMKLALEQVMACPFSSYFHSYYMITDTQFGVFPLAVVYSQ